MDIGGVRDLGILDWWWSGLNIGGLKGGWCGSCVFIKVGIGGIWGMVGLGVIVCMLVIEVGI